MTEDIPTQVVTCTTPDCENRGVRIIVPTATEIDGELVPVEGVQCGPCGATLATPAEDAS